MLTIGRILHDYQEAGSVNSLLALWGFVDDTTFLTKAGHVGVVYRLRGIDYEGLTHEELRALVHRFEAALRLLDEHCRVYQYLVKRMVDPFESRALRAARRPGGHPAPNRPPQRASSGTIRHRAVSRTRLRTADPPPHQHGAS